MKIELLKRHEGKNLEYKRDLSSPDGILKCLVAFANTAGGTVIIGVEDQSKNVRGVADDGSLRHLLARLGRIDMLVIDDCAVKAGTRAAPLSPHPFLR